MLIENPLNSSELSFPILECIHIVGFAICVGTVGMVDLSLLGVGLTRQTPAQLSKDTWLWTLFALIVVIFSGLLLFSSDPDNYYLNWSFNLKMVFLLAAILFNYTVHRKAVSQASAGSHKGVAIVSLVLWTLVIFGGIFIGFLNSTLDLKNI